MQASEFRRALESRLNTDQILLRIVIPPKLLDPQELSGREILARARELVEQYAPPDAGKVVLLLLPHSLELFLIHLGLVLEGYVPAILPWPTTRVDAEKYQRNLLYQLQALPASCLVSTPRLAENLAVGLPYPVAACPVANAAQYDRMFGSPLSTVRCASTPSRNPELPVEALFLQFSGGTTGMQKAVVVTAKMLATQLELLQQGLRFGSADSVVSWLPLYHDMGLIACLWFPLWCSQSSLHFANSDWLLDPELLFHYLERFRGTLCWLPNFAFSYLAARREYMKRHYSLSHVRGFINCSEPVRLSSMQAFLDKFRSWGLQPEALQTCYAMAENVFAVTQSCPQEEPQMVRRSVVTRLGTNPQLSFSLRDDVFVSSGRTLPGNEVRIVDSVSGILPDGVPGEIQIRTPTLFSGYWSAGTLNTSSICADGFHRTGDYGFLLQGELYVIGRIKDIMIVAGQNIFPEDIEISVAEIPGIYPGRTVSFGVPDSEYGTDAVVVVAEMKGQYDGNRALQIEKGIRSAVLATVGIAARHVAVVPEHWIIKSTAGKISRQETRERFLREFQRNTITQTS